MNNIIKLITVLANIIIIYYVFNLKAIKCKCSESIYREYIFYYSIIHIFLTTIMFIAPLFFAGRGALSTLLKLVLGLGMIGNVLCLYNYSKHLVGCKCASDNMRHFMEMYSYFYMGLLVAFHLYIYDFYIQNNNLTQLIKRNTMDNILNIKIN
jgi:hypothetical protein